MKSNSTEKFDVSCSCQLITGHCLIDIEMHRNVQRKVHKPGVAIINIGTDKMAVNQP